MRKKDDIEKIDEQIKILNGMIDDNRPEVIRDGDREIIIDKLSSGTKKIQKIDELENIPYTDKNNLYYEKENTKEIENLEEDESIEKGSDMNSSNILNKIIVMLVIVLFLLLLFLLCF